MVYSHTVKRVVVIGIALLGIFVLGYFVYAALKPIAVVGDTEISGSMFKDHRNAFQSYARAIEAANAELGKTLQNIPQDVSDRAALEELIVQEVVRQELVGVFGGETQSKVNTAIDADLAGQDITSLTTAAEKVYGLSWDEFRTLVLTPVTREKLLRDHVEKTLGQDYDTWLDERVRAATVTFPRGGYVWREGKVVEE